MGSPEPGTKLLPILEWGPAYRREDLRSDLSAGLTVGAMLVPQAMAYALLAGLPPQVGLYASTIPVLVYAVLGTSRQLAVGPVAIVSLLTATALAPVVAEGTAGYVAAAAVLALLVGLVHLGLGAFRLGFLLNLLSHAVLVGFTAAAAVVIGFSQIKHLIGVDVARQDHFYQTVLELASQLGQVHGPTLAVGFGSLVSLLALKRLAPKVPSALLVVVGSLLATRLFNLEQRGVAVVGDIPDSLPSLTLPSLDGSLIGALLPTAFIITLVGVMESMAVAKVYARRHRYQVDPNRELIGLGASNVASGLFGGYPVTGGFSRTAVNESAGARTPLASIITAVLVLVSIAFLTPLLSSLPKASLGAIIVVAVIGLIDVAEMRHIAKVKPSDLVSLAVAFFGTLALGIEVGIGVAILASMLVVFARLSAPHSAVLGRIADTTTYRNVERFPEASTWPGIHLVRIDAGLSFVNAANIKKLLLEEAESIRDTEPGALVVDASGLNDLDTTGAEMLHELLDELDERGLELHLTDVRGPVRDVLRLAGLWDELALRVHANSHEAVAVLTGRQAPSTDYRRCGTDERTPPDPGGPNDRTPSPDPSRQPQGDHYESASGPAR
jgi:SulP family sulfate permease